MNEDPMETYGRDSRGRTLNVSGPNITLPNFAESHGMGHVRVHRVGSRWQTYICGLSLSPSFNNTPSGYGDTIDEAYQDLVLRIRGEEVFLFTASDTSPSGFLWTETRVPSELIAP